MRVRRAVSATLTRRVYLRRKSDRVRFVRDLHGRGDVGAHIGEGAAGRVHHDYDDEPDGRIGHQSTASVTPAANSGTNIASVSVDFDDGTTTSLGAVTGSSIAIHHVYPNPGTYRVTLNASDSNGGVGIAATTVFVQAAPPLGVSVVVTMVALNNTNTAVNFTATVTGLGTPSSKTILGLR